ncbi:MAG: DUF493 domain-containing protein [Halieaceae bacterium]|jgi:uncharacterized protein|nr:DUF493 domain-containing protein [Halieaceae bacterium]
MQEQKPPKIEFPCGYPIKILGRNQVNFESIVLAVVERHAPDFDRRSVKAKKSSKGTFSSINITITATGPEQLEALHRELLATGLVKMVI